MARLLGVRTRRCAGPDGEHTPPRLPGEGSACPSACGVVKIRSSGHLMPRVRRCQRKVETDGRMIVGVNAEPFQVAVSKAELKDLHDRIRRTRWPDPAPGEPWSQGVDLAYLRDLLAYWADGFDWRARERELNRFEHRIAEVRGVRIHLVHHHRPGNRLALVLTHGWPSTFVELLPLVERLGDRFDLVIPSLPGYAFSERPRQVGVDRAFVADLWHDLMEGLGYRRYGAHGGDFGAGVATSMALAKGDRLAGIHLSPAEMSPYVGPGSPPLSA